MAERLETNIVRFRTAWGGFNKQDVTDYLIKINASHREALVRLNARVEQLEKENEALQQPTADAQQLQELESYNQRLMDRVRMLEDQLAEAQEALAACEAAPAEPQPAPAEVFTQAPVTIVEIPQESQLMTKELEAYRRAEAMERRVAQRYRQVTCQVEKISGGIVQELTNTVDTARVALTAIENQLAALQGASRHLDTTMADGVEKLEAMSDEYADLVDLMAE